MHGASALRLQASHTVPSLCVFMLSGFSASCSKSWFQRFLLRCASSGAVCPGHEASDQAGQWQVSSLGRIRSPTGSVSYGVLLPSGYRQVKIAERGYQVHRLVASTFLGPPKMPGQWQVNHIDRNPSNNNVGNLSYVTPSQNALHSWATNTHRRSNAAVCSKPVLWRSWGRDLWSYCPSQCALAGQLGIPQSSISHCCRKGMTHIFSKGSWFEFRFAARPEDPVTTGATAEVWEAAKYPGKYSAECIPDMMVSNHGRIQYASQYHSHITRGTAKGAGYLYVHRSSQTFLVHRVVAATFLGQPVPANLQVNHIDGNRGNNTLQNLEYVTRSQNILHAYSLERREKRGSGGKAVQGREIVGSKSNWQVFRSINAAALSTGVRPEIISKICRGHRADARGWEFRLLEEETLPNEEWRHVILTGARVQR